MKQKILLGISILVVLLFLVQPVASLNVNNIDTELIDVNTDASQDTADGITENGAENKIVDKTKIDVKSDKKLKSYRVKMEENRQRMMSMDRNVAIPEYDYENIIRSVDEIDLTNFDKPTANREMLETQEPKEIRFGTPLLANPSSKSRAAAADLEVSQLEWENKINDGWGAYTESTTLAGNNPYIGGFMVGVATKITVTVVNHNPTTQVNNIKMNFTIFDFYGGIPLIKIPSSVDFSVFGATTTVDFNFNPPAAKSLYIAAYIDYPDDTDQSNNGYGIYGMPTLIWASDFETTGYDHGSQTDKTWTGDMGTTDNTWYKTTTAEQQSSPDHTTVNSYHHGIDNGALTDDYDDSYNAIYMESPQIDMTNGNTLPISDGQKEVGTLDDGFYYIFATPSWAGLFTGELEAPAQNPTFDTIDIVWAYEYTDTPSSPFDWKDPIAKELGGFIWGDWTTIWTGQTVATWNPNIRFLSQSQAVYGWPFELQTGDGSGGQRPNNGALNYTNVKFRTQFDGDEDGSTNNLPGIYGDDFVTWGYQEWLPPYLVSLSKVTNVESNNVPILYPNVQASFDTTIKNYGEALTDVPIKVVIKDDKGNDVHTPPDQTFSSLAEDSTIEYTKTWTWTPTKAGAYYIYITAGDLNSDYTPDNNKRTLKVYVTEPKGRVLLVDDDNSMHSNGIFFRDVEGKMMESLDALEISYNIYNVERNGTGPTKAIMDNYEAVIWMTGLDNEYSNYGRNPTWASNYGTTFKPEDQTQIQNFLNEGDKNLWVISPGVLYDLTNTKDATSPTGFLKDYLHVIYCNANETEYNSNGDISVRGTPTVLIGEKNSLGQGANYDTYSTEPVSSFSDMGGVIDKDSKSLPVFFQNTAKTAYNSLQYSENYNLVYFAFNFYLIDDLADRKDLTYRVLNFFGMVGGVDVDLDDTPKKKIDFGQTVSFKFKITNLGLMTETMNIKLESPSPSNIPSGWAVKLNEKNPDATINELSVAGNMGVRYFYLNVTAPSGYLDKDGNLDSTLKNISADSEIQFKVRVESKNYPDNFYDFASCKVVMDLNGYVQLTAAKTSDEIDVAAEFESTEYYVEYSILLRNVTNGDEDVDVYVTVDKDNDITAEVLQASSVITDSTIVLPPRLDQEVTVRVSADEHEPMGDYPVEFKVMNEDHTSLLNSTTLVTTVEQYYDIDISTSESKTYSRIVEPNKMTSEVQTEEFDVNIENYGNGPDTVELKYVDNAKSPTGIPYDWETELDLVEIFEKDGSETIDEIEVPAYDKLSGTPGTVTVTVKINIPQDGQEGRYWFDLLVKSSAPRTYMSKLNREDFMVEVNTTFQIQVILPELTVDQKESKLLKADGTDIIDNVDTIYNGDTVSVYILVKNSGSAGVDDVDIELTISKDNVQYNAYQETLDIEPDETVNISWSYTVAEVGIYSFKVELDANDKILGDLKNDNSWNKILQVKERPQPKDKEDGGILGGGGGKSGIAGNPFYIILIIVIIIIIVVVVLFFMMQRKKSEEDDLDDITMLGGGPMGGMPMGQMGQQPPGGMMGMPGGMQPQAGMPQRDKPMQPATSPEIKALSPQSQKQLPPAEGTGKTCSSCGEKNPPENKFCQGCGGKL